MINRGQLFFVASVGGLYFGTSSTLAPVIFSSGLIDDVRIYNRVIQLIDRSGSLQLTFIDIRKKIFLHKELSICIHSISIGIICFHIRKHTLLIILITRITAVCYGRQVLSCLPGHQNNVTKIKEKSNEQTITHNGD
jgi:hypothetical protein